MKVDEYIEQCHMAPIEEEAFAFIAMKVEDDPRLRKLADEYLAAKSDFFTYLDNLGIEIG